MRTGAAVAKEMAGGEPARPVYTTVRLLESDVDNLAALAAMDATTLAEAFRKRFGKALRDERISRTEAKLRELKAQKD
jgi:AraC-like DNA-binding protein